MKEIKIVKGEPIDNEHEFSQCCSTKIREVCGIGFCSDCREQCY